MIICGEVVPGIRLQSPKRAMQEEVETILVMLWFDTVAVVTRGGYELWILCGNKVENISWSVSSMILAGQPILPW